jgi:tRNA-2-methylthio-N6-dimethylallyladenosine synthase
MQYGQAMNDLSPLPKKVFVKTYGCQMNVYDSQRMEDVLGAEGYEKAAAIEEADLVILNTCHIREKAVEKVYSELGKIKEMKAERQKAGSEMLIAVAGCVGQAEGAEIVRRQKSVDLVLGPQTYHRLPHMLAQHRASGKPVIETEFEATDKFDALKVETERKPVVRNVASFLTVQEGCDKFCSFCVVPYTRGAEFSRPVSQVLDEARKLVANGVREVTLLGQNVNAYRGPNDKGVTTSLASLVAQLSEIEGLARIRYTTSHPRDMSDDLIEAHANNPKLMPYLHLPVQAGSDAVLKRMNRGHTAQQYIDLIARVRKARPDIAISGDFIVGFPGETDQDFEDTMALVRQVKYSSAYSFKYSPRPGTPAADKTDQVPEDVKAQRLARLQELLTEQLKAFNTACMDRELPVLLEKPGRNPGQWIGRSPYLQSVHLETTEAVGKIVKARIVSVMTNSLGGLQIEAA